MRETVDLQIMVDEFILNRDERLFNKIYDFLKPRFISHTKKILYPNYGYSDLEVDDIVANCFSKIYSNINVYDNDYNFSTWCFSILKNEILQFIKYRNKVSNINSNYIIENYVENEKENILNVQHCEIFNYQDILRSEYDNYIVNPQYDYLSQELFEDLINKVKEEMLLLEPKYKNLLIDREINKMSYIELSIKYKLKMGTLKTQIHKARQILQSRLSDIYLEWRKL